MTRAVWFRLRCDFCGEYEFVSTPIQTPAVCHHCGRPVELHGVAHGETTRGLPILTKAHPLPQGTDFDVWQGNQKRRGNKLGWHANKSSGSLRMVKR
jgi:hypothetical protein